MKKKVLNKFSFLIFFIIVFSVAGNFAQDRLSVPDDENIKRAKEIVNTYQQTTGVGKFIGSIAYLSAEFNFTWFNSQVTGNSLDKLKFGRPNQLGYETQNAPNALEYHYTGVWDGQTYFEKGQAGDGTNKINKKIKLSEDEQKNNSDLKDLRRRIFTLFYPITFENPPYYTFDLKYVGVAKSPNGSVTDVIEATEGSLKHQFLFDRDSHLLVMWITTKSNGNRITRVFSDYRKNEGILIPYKIESKPEGGTGMPTIIEISKFTVSTKDHSDEFIISEK